MSSLFSIWNSLDNVTVLVLKKTKTYRRQDRALTEIYHIALSNSIYCDRIDYINKSDKVTDISLRRTRTARKYKGWQSESLRI